MNKAILLKISIVLLMCSFLIQIITAVCMVFMQGPMIRMGIFGALAEIHEYNGFVLIGLVIVHLFFNWGWVRNNLLKKRER